MASLLSKPEVALSPDRSRQTPTPHSAFSRALSLKAVESILGWWKGRERSPEELREEKALVQDRFGKKPTPGIVQFEREVRAHGIQLRGVTMNQAAWHAFWGPDITPANFWEKIFPEVSIGPDSTLKIKGGSLNPEKKSLSFEIIANVLGKEGSLEIESRVKLARKQVEIEYFKLDIDDSGKGVGSALFDGLMMLYRERGIERVTLTAALGVGGYFWPKKGFLLKDLEEAKSMLGDKERESPGQIGRKVVKLRSDLNKAEMGETSISDRVQTQILKNALDYVEVLLKEGREYAAAGNLEAAQRIIPAIAAFKTEVPSAYTDHFEYGVNPNTLGKYLLCETTSDVVYDFNDFRCRAIYSAKGRPESPALEQAQALKEPEPNSIAAQEVSGWQALPPRVPR